MSQAEPTTSSIDANWPPCPGSNDRIRGFYPELIIATDGREVDDFVSTYHKTAEELLIDTEGNTRLSLRAVVSGEVAAYLETDCSVVVEAAMPLFGETYEGLFLVYVAKNKPPRNAACSEMQKHRDTISKAVNKYTGHDQSYRHPHGEDLMINVVKPGQTKNIRVVEEKLLSLYSVFGLGEAEVGELLGNPDNIIATLENKTGDVLSTVLAETAKIAINENPDLRITEITEAVTHPEHTGNGHYSLVSRFLVDNVVRLASEEHQPLNAVYGESNLSSVGVILAAAKNRRRFNSSDRELIGINNQNFGILEQNFKVDDGVETRPFNDFALSYHQL